MTLGELEASLAALRRQGVKSFTDVAGGGFEVEFFPESAGEQGPIPVMGDILDKPCRCGHLASEHNGEAGLCLRGCDPEKCAPEAA